MDAALSQFTSYEDLEARVVKHSSFVASSELAAYQNKDPHLNKHIYPYVSLELGSTQARASMRLMRTWDALETEFEINDYEHLNELNGEFNYRRWISIFFSVLVGATHLSEYKDQQTRANVGLGHTLTMLVESKLLLDQKAELRFDLEQRLQWTNFLFSDLKLSFQQKPKTELSQSLMYGSNWSWAFGISVDEKEADLNFLYRF